MGQNAWSSHKRTPCTHPWFPGTRTQSHCTVPHLVASSTSQNMSPAPTLRPPRRVAEVIAPTSTSPISEAERWARMSYNQQYEELYSNKPLNIKKVVPKPSKEAQMSEPGAGTIPMSDVATVSRRNWLFNRTWNKTDLLYAAFIGGMHVLACFAPFTFSPEMVALFFGSYFVTGCLGITLSYHRMLSHKSFTAPKWLEYILAYCGVLAVQVGQLWVSVWVQELRRGVG